MRLGGATGYDGAVVDDLRARLLSLPDTSHRRMFGADCFLTGGRMFAFVVEEALVLKLPEERYQEALALPGVQPFTMRGVPFGRWARFPTGDTAVLLSWLETACQHVRSQRSKARRRRRSGAP